MNDGESHRMEIANLTENEQRNRMPAIPGDLRSVLTENQILSIRRIEGFGWELKFIRRHGVKSPIAVVKDPDGKTLGVLEDDGRINLQHNVKIRP
jgi:hypothetical protein